MSAREIVPESANSTFKIEPAPGFDAPGLSKAHNAPLVPKAADGPHITSAVGASWSKLAFGRGPGRRGGGGLRGEITEFSKASRRRLMQLLNSINREEAPLPYFVTLTYHETWPKDRQGRKAHMDAFQKRLERALGKFAAVWRLEFQKRGAPHYHLLIFLPPGALGGDRGQDDHQRRYEVLTKLRNRVAFMWHEIAGYGSPEHFSAGTSVERVKSWRGVNSYAAKYMGKLEQLQEGAPSVGRFWGVWRRGMLPITYATHSLTTHEALRLRRIFRNFSKVRQRSNRGDLAVVCCFVGHSTTNRLLAWLGIIGTEAPGVRSSIART